MNRTAIFGLCVLALLLALNSWFIHQEKMKSGLGQVAAGSHSLPVNGAAAASDPPAAAPPLLGAEARLSPTRALTNSDPVPVNGRGPEPVTTGALVGVLDQYEFSTPTPEDLTWLTIDSWSQPEFLELTQDEAHELLALDDTMGLKGPDTMLSIAGPLPTLDDCRIGFRSESVQKALRWALLWSAVVTDIGIEEIEMGSTQGVREMKELALRQQLAAEEALMVELEKATTYPSWRLWWRLYREWSQ